MIFETHAHYDDDRFAEDRDEILKSLPEAGIGIVINSGASVESTRDTVELAKKYGDDISPNFINGILASIVKESENLC